MKTIKAEDVFKFADLLSKQEQTKLLRIIKNNLEKLNEKKPLITKQESDEYIYKHVFCKVK
jgi:hypothetical protein